MALPPIADWRIYPSAPERSVYFRAEAVFPAMEQDGTLSMARVLAETALARPASQSLRRWAMEFDGINYRCERMPNGGLAVRVIPHDIPTLDDLNVPAPYQALLLNEQLKRIGGLVLVCGLAGSGKSTTVAATVSQRLKLHTTYALTYENPLEFTMQGRHGNGYCDQNTVDDLDYPSALAGSLRCFPSQVRSMLFVGEILDGSSMREIMKVMMNGHLVFTTAHGRGIIETLQRLMALAGAEDSKAQREIFATSLRLVIHQRLEQGRLSMSALQVSPAAEQLIANGTLLNLKDEIGRTEDKLWRK